jgi:hypothetical protein
MGSRAHESNLDPVTKRPLRALLCALFLGAALPVETGLTTASAQPGPNVNPQFVGQWCVQGDPSKIGTITPGGLGLQLTNETGSTSPAQPVGLGGSTIVALQWNLVQGTLAPDASRINWTNGTYWNHCNSGGGKTLDGTWYAGGDPRRACSISQRLGSLTFINENGTAAAGNFDGPSHLVATWQGTPIGGTVSADGSRISWDNGTFWSRR